MEQEQLDKISEADIDYVIISKNIDDILEDLNFDDEEEKLLCESIISNLEKCASETIKNNKIAQLPFIGCVRKNPVRQAMRDNYTNFRIARKNMTKEQYKEHVRAFMNAAKEEIAAADRRKLAIKRIRSNNKKKYATIYTKLGRAYAEMFIFAIYCLKEVPFDQEVQDAFDRLKE